MMWKWRMEMRKKSFLNKILIWFFIIGSILFFLYAFIREKTCPPLSYLGLIPLMFLPICVEKITKKNVPNSLQSFYYIFCFFAYFLGAVLKFYGKVDHFDTLVHFSSGVFTSLIAITIWIGSKARSKNVIFILFVLGFSTFLAYNWEGLEFISDYFTGKDGQHVMDTGVEDTMKDIFMALLGAISIIILYEIDCKRKKGIMYQYKKEVEVCYE